MGRPSNEMMRASGLELTDGQQIDRQPLLLFDGHCGLCNASVDFAMARDPRAALRFAPLQSPAGKRILRAVGLPEDYCESVVMVDRGRVWARSAAGLMMLRRLRAPWRWLWPLVYVPAVVRDPVYRVIAATRYRVWGRRETCRVPTPRERERFVMD